MLLLPLLLRRSHRGGTGGPRRALYARDDHLRGSQVSSSRFQDSLQRVWWEKGEAGREGVEFGFGFSFGFGFEFLVAAAVADARCRCSCRSRNSSNRWRHKGRRPWPEPLIFSLHSSAGNSLSKNLFAAGRTPEKTFSLFCCPRSLSPAGQSAKRRRPTVTAAVEAAVTARTRRWKRVADSRGKGDLAGGIYRRRGGRGRGREKKGLDRNASLFLSFSLSLFLSFSLFRCYFSIY